MPEPAEKPRVSLKLSRREREIVGEISEGLIQIQNIIREDAREEVIRAIVEHKHGSHEPHLKRLTPEPWWDKVFELRACPNCNPFARNTGRLMPAGDLMECRVCHLKITNELFERARESHEKEKKWFERQEGLDEKVAKYNIRGQHLDKLLTMAEERAEAELRRRQQPPEEAGETPEERDEGA